jgi:SNF2 family DNA or RNA helicase
MEILQAYLESSPAVHKISHYHGRMTQEQKDAVIDGTKGELSQTEDRHEVLLLQIQSGAVGLNLQHFTKIIFMSPWWTAALMDQAVGRAVRIGQKEIVEVTLLLLKEEETMNIDEKILEKAESKRGMLEKIFLHASRGLPEQKPEPEAEAAPEAAPEAEEAPEAREELGPVAAA